MDHCFHYDRSKYFLNICQRGNEDQLKNFINENNDCFDWIIYRNYASGDTGLHLAVQNGHINIVKLLFKYSKNPKTDIDVMNLELKRPLHIAAQFSRFDIIKFLIHQGVLVNTFKKADWTPLMLACTKSGLEAKACIELLLEANANPFLRNKDGWTAFFIACRTGDYEIVNFLLNKLGKKCIESKSNNGRTALHICAFHGHLDILNLLGSKYSNLLEIRDSVGYTPLHESIKNRHYVVTKKLIELGTNILTFDNCGRTILHTAALCKNIEVLEYILNNNLIDPNLKDSFQNTAYNIAEENKLQDILKSFEKFGVKC